MKTFISTLILIITLPTMAQHGGTPQHSGHPQQMAPRANQGHSHRRLLRMLRTWLTPTLVLIVTFPCSRIHPDKCTPRQWNTGLHDRR